MLEPRRKTRTLSAELADTLGQRIRNQEYPPGTKLPKEMDIMNEFGVSRTVVREAISHLQAAGMAETRHGIGTFALLPEDNGLFRVHPDQISTLRDTIALLELRIGLETEAAALAATRRTEENLAKMQLALTAFKASIEAGQNAVQADFQFHTEIALATQNNHFIQFMALLGERVIPRSRLSPSNDLTPARQAYLQRVHLEHESIFNAILHQDVDAARAATRTHLSNSRERLRMGEINAK
ncbi:FadR/GntR family transcriptional regulator [Limnohabitans sp.]|uniref:FadR/GntR family transcriptional regulator n=1 Tax=Limnohabitans sp. TaxID=1907725 RepID=UPI00334191C0